MERGYDKLIDLDVSITPHTEEPDKTLEQLREQLIEMTEPNHNGRR